ncbi:MAG: EAL domain-containing protein [Xenococcaceae cyanobacterium]
MRDSQPVCHTLVIEDKKFRQTVSLEENTYSIGRHSSNSIVLPSQLVSRHHATFLRVKYPENKNDVFWIIDGDLRGNRSTNGLFVNGKRCLSHELKSGDSILFGGEVKATYYIINDSNTALLKTSKFKKYNADKNPINDLKSTLISEKELDELTGKFFFILTSLPELLPHPIIDINLEGEITYINSAAILKFQGIQEAKLEHPILAGLLINSQEKQGKLLVREVKIGQEVFEQYVHYLSESKQIRSYIFDLTKRKQIETALRESEERYRAVVRQISEGILLVDVATKCILEANAAYCNLLGYTSEEILGLTVYDVVALDREIVERDLERIWTEKLDLVVESLHRSKDGSLVNVEVSVSLIYYGTKEVLCFAVRDITERKRAEEMLQYQAFHDLLTDLPNRALFNEQLSKALANARRNQNLMAVMFLDLDRFKNINDTLDHAIGDQLLQGFAERLKSCLRSGDTLARWGGDEFTVLLPQIHCVEDAAKIGKRILDALKQPFELEEYQLHINSSIGIALYPQDGEEGETLLKNADAALYRTKEQGGNNYQFYSPTMTSKTEALLRLENFLHYALEQEEFLLYYQPQININTGELSGMEALLRWQHPELGQVSPEQFIPLAEETGLIVHIGEWVLRTACTQNKGWQEAGLPPLRMAVNLSPRQFQQPNLVSTVARVLDDSGLEPDFLELEITETTIMQNMEFARKALGHLQQMGVHISMDDFGTGYSSLGYLKKFPFHKIKIDQSFVRDLKNNPQDLAIVSAVIALGRGFNLRVVAEGVETQQQLELLRNLQCCEIQGYLFSRPLSAQDATKFLARKEWLKVIYSDA